MLGLAHKACMEGYTSYYLCMRDLMEVLQRAKDLNCLGKKLVWMKKPNLVVIDEVGYEKLKPEQANLFFQLINARYENCSTIITTNKPFSKWGEIMADDAIATATLDRLLYHSHVIVMKGESYRLKDKLKTGLNFNE